MHAPFHVLTWPTTANLQARTRPLIALRTRPLVINYPSVACPTSLQQYRSLKDSRSPALWCRWSCMRCLAYLNNNTWPPSTRALVNLLIQIDYSPCYCWGKPAHSRQRIWALSTGVSIAHHSGESPKRLSLDSLTHTALLRWIIQTV